VTSARPSLELLRSLTDEHVLRALMDERRLTRAELASRTGISKPTISESVRRLDAAGLIADTGERTSGRGRVGTYYALSAGVGSALVVAVAPAGVVAEIVDVHGDVIARAAEPLLAPTGPAQVAAALRAAVAEVRAGLPRSPRVGVVSAADPVDRVTGRLVHLPDAPFLIGELYPVDELAGAVDGPVHVDNDVNWAARAERSADAALDDFVYLHLGEGLGCAVVTDGEVRRGHSGLAGEIAHVTTTGRGGVAVAFTEVFAQLELRRAGSTAIDVPALRAAVERAGHDALEVLARATAGVLAAAIAFADPQLVVVGGDWGAAPAVLAAIRRESELIPRHVPVRAAGVAVEPALRGARSQAVAQLRALVLARGGGAARAE
jgi:predicted NBD/HSP70 family sugar kinase